MEGRPQWRPGNTSKGALTVPCGESRSMPITYMASCCTDTSRRGRSRMTADSRCRLLLRQYPKTRAEMRLSYASRGPSVGSADAGKRLMEGCSKRTRAVWCTQLIHGANASLTRDFEDGAVRRMNRRM